MDLLEDPKFFMNGNSMNGLTNFIKEIRACRAHDLEKKRVNKELAHIRSKFKEANLTGYNKKKYIAKLLYMYVLGFEVDFGHLEAVNLMASRKFQEKQIAYLAVTLMISESHELAPLVVNSIRKDLNEGDESFNCLALHAIANITSNELSEMLIKDIFKLFVSSTTSPLIKKKAGLCILRVYRKFPDLIPAEAWAPQLLNEMKDTNLAVVHSATCLVMALAQQHEDSYKEGVSLAIVKLHQIVVKKEFQNTSIYYKITSPWLQIKLLRFLQYYPANPDREMTQLFNDIMQSILETSKETFRKIQQANASNGIMLEAINCLIHMSRGSKVLRTVADILGGLLTSEDVNMRYLALETMTHLAAIGDPLESLGCYQSTITLLLDDKDVSIKRQALDLLYSMCESRNVRQIVSDLLAYLGRSDQEFREEMILKIAILAEKYVSEYTWYVDVMLQLIKLAGDDANEMIWHRVVHIVTNHEDVREYAAYTMMQALKLHDCHEMAVRIGGYLLGEYGHFIVESPGCSPFEQFMALHSKFGLFSRATKAILLTSYFKLVNLFPEIRKEIIRVLENFQYVLDMELQQRACEYLSIIQLGDEDLLQTVCAEMPHFPERESILVNELRKKNNNTEDTRVFTIGGKDAQKIINSIDGKKITPSNTVDNSAMRDLSATKKQSDNLLDMTQGGCEIHQEPASNTQVKKWLKNLRTLANGVIYEDNIVQIGIKSGYQLNTGKLTIFCGNKSGVALENFKANIDSNLDVSFSLESAFNSSIAAGAQMQQVSSIECIGAMNGSIPLTISFSCSSKSIGIDLIAPVSVCKFITPVTLAASDFFARWGQIGGPPNEVQMMMRPPAIDIVALKSTIAGLQFQVLEGVDPISENIVAAGIFNSSSIGKVGCLLRIESNMQHQVRIYRVTIRTTNEKISSLVCAQLSEVINE